MDEQQKGIRAKLLGAELKREKIDLPGIGEGWVRELTAGEQDEIEEGRRKAAQEGAKPFHMRAFLASVALCDADGVPLFGEKDREMLGRVSAATLSRITEVALRLSGYGSESPEEDARKN